MKQEIDCYLKLEGIDGIPKLHFHGIDEEKDNYLMVLQLLGYDLEKLLTKCSHKFSLKPIFMLAEQMILRLKSIHERSFVDRDLKPENILIGINENEKNEIFLIDLDITREYIDSGSKSDLSLIHGIGL